MLKRLTDNSGEPIIQLKTSFGGGTVGQMVLNEISHIFGRVEFVWTPVAFEEGYEIVCRLLFKECTDSKARENVCLAFARMYLNDTNDFPYKSYQGNYRQLPHD